jgi:hypothetical protein
MSRKDFIMKKYAKCWIALAGAVISVVAPAAVPGLTPELIHGVIGLLTAGGVYAVPNG